MSKKRKVSFQNLLKRFPVIDLPVTLGENTEREFYTRHEPLPEALIDAFLPVFFPIELRDEFMEFVPCFKLKDTTGFHALVLWVAGLTVRSYFLVTLNDKGEELQCRAIGGMSFDEESISRTITRIEEDWMIYTVTSVSEDETDLEARSETISEKIELLPDGSIRDVD
ncbi:MAG: hypothetical protein EA409_13995 [Saprospirales bacterium]|nr:MAG: hypothetical protein EA409_13995 [Saprospirales bacterium]